MGYSSHTAIADLVDNSITANARKVQIELSPFVSGLNGWIRIEDDGQGMNANELINAMRWGGIGPLSSRKSNDLGRFGLGLKTASISLGRRLTVISKKTTPQAPFGGTWIIFTNVVLGTYLKELIGKMKSF